MRINLRHLQVGLRDLKLLLGLRAVERGQPLPGAHDVADVDVDRLDLAGGAEIRRAGVTAGQRARGGDRLRDRRTADRRAARLCLRSVT